MTVVDSSVWIDLLNSRSTAQTDWLRRNISSGEIAVTDLILCEVLKGMRDELHAVKADQLLLRLPCLDQNSPMIALLAAFHYRNLRLRGFTIRSTVDCVIAAMCLHGGHSLLHQDRDFDVFERELGLKVLHP